MHTHPSPPSPPPSTPDPTLQPRAWASRPCCMLAAWYCHALCLVLPPSSLFPRGLLPVGLHCLTTPKAHPAAIQSALTFWAPGPRPRVLLVPRAPSHVLRASAARPTLLPALCGEPGTMPGCLGAQPGQGELSSRVCVGVYWSEAGARGGSEPQVPGGHPPSSPGHPPIPPPVS